MKEAAKTAEQCFFCFSVFPEAPKTHRNFGGFPFLHFIFFNCFSIFSSKKTQKKAVTSSKKTFRVIGKLQKYDWADLDKGKVELGMEVRCRNPVSYKC